VLHIAHRQRAPTSARFAFGWTFTMPQRPVCRYPATVRRCFLPEHFYKQGVRVMPKVSDTHPIRTSVRDFIEGLRGLEGGLLTKGGVAQFVADAHLQVEALAPYIFGGRTPIRAT
jgi:hypothetical protein